MHQTWSAASMARGLTGRRGRRRASMCSRGRVGGASRATYTHVLREPFYTVGRYVFQDFWRKSTGPGPRQSRDYAHWDLRQFLKGKVRCTGAHEIVGFFLSLQAAFSLPRLQRAPLLATSTTTPLCSLSSFISSTFKLRTEPTFKSNVFHCEYAVENVGPNHREGFPKNPQTKVAEPLSSGKSSQWARFFQP